MQPATKDPKSKRDFSEQTRETLSKGQRFRVHGDGIIEFREIRPGREPTGQTSYVAMFDVIEEGSNGFVFGVSYTTTEYLALASIEAGDMEPIN